MVRVPLSLQMRCKPRSFPGVRCRDRRRVTLVKARFSDMEKASCQGVNLREKPGVILRASTRGARNRCPEGPPGRCRHGGKTADQEAVWSLFRPYLHHEQKKNWALILVND